MDERVMLRWVEDSRRTLHLPLQVPYHPRNPSGFIPLPHHGVVTIGVNKHKMGNKYAQV